MKRIVALALFCYLITAPRALSQVAKVGDYSPVDVPFGDNVSSGDSGPLHCNSATGACVGYQAFDLASGAYITATKIGVIQLPNPAGGEGAWGVTIWYGAIGGPEVIHFGEPWIFPASTTDQLMFFTFNYDPQSLQWLPAGHYVMSVWGSVSLGCTVPSTPISCGLEWAPNQSGSAQIGVVDQGFYSDQYTTAGIVPLAPLAGTNGTFAFQLFAPRVKGRPHGGSRGQIIRLVAGPITPAPGSPVEAQLGFLDINGNPIGSASSVTINPGQTQSLDLNLNDFVALVGQRIEVQPVVTLVPNAAGVPPDMTQVSATVQILDAATGIGTVLDPLPQPGVSVPPLAPQILAGGQIMRFNVVAGDANPCVGQISFADQNGSPLGPNMPLNLAPGTGASLDLNASILGQTLGQRIEVQPILDVTTPLTAGPPLNSVCQASVEVFDVLTGCTRTYQSTAQSTSTALPAVE